MNPPIGPTYPPRHDANGRHRPTLSLHDHSEFWPCDGATLGRLAAILDAALPLVLQHPGPGTPVLGELSDIEITLLDDAALALVHRDFLDDPSPTDVITFHHGEILVSVETAVREARARGSQSLRETALYAIHGLLHLHGHEDAEPSARDTMHSVQEQILQAVWPLPPMPPIPILLATHNTHKTAEVRAILGERWAVTDLTAFPGAPEPVESGSTFAENAQIKALAASALIGPDQWVLADDSGLEVDVLDGAPGVHSARYSGSHGDSAGHRAKLLAELDRVGAQSSEARRARFRCVLALVRHGEVAAIVEGAVEGAIAPAEQGTHGFGYDPLFIPEGHTTTFGELADEVKNSLSHRARALAAMTTLHVWEDKVEGSGQGAGDKGQK